MANTALANIGNVLSYVALGLVIAAQPNANWLIFQSASTQLGLYQACVSGGICTSLSWNPGWSLSDYLPSFVMRVVLITADVFLAIAFFCTLVMWCLSESGRKVCLITAGSFNILSGVIMLGGNIAYTVLVVVFSPLLLPISGLPADYYLGYCFTFVWVSGGLLIGAGIMQIVASPKRSQSVRPDTADSAYSNAAFNNQPIPRANYNGSNPAQYYPPGR